MIDLAQILFVYVSPIIAVTMLLLNFAEICSIFRQKNKITSSAIAYVLNLSISDFLVGFAIIMVKIIYYIWKYTNNGTAELLFYIAKYYLVRFSLFVSVFSLIAMTLIRWLAIKHPMKHRTFIQKYTTKMCVLIWSLSFLAVTCLYCIFRFTVDTAKFDQYEVIIFPIIVYPATAVFAFSYYHIRNLYIRKEANKPANIRKNRSLVDKVHLFTIRSTVAFMICWVPLATYGLAKYFNAFTGWKNMRHLEYSLFVLAFINSVIDPILYFSSAFSSMRRRNNRINVVSRATEDSTHTLAL